MKRLLPFLAILIISLVGFAQAAPIPNYTQISHITNSSGTMPFPLWFSAGLIGFALFLWTLPPRKETAELEYIGAVSVISWIPIGVTTYFAWSVDSISVIGDTFNNTYQFFEIHQIQHFEVVGIIYGVLFVVAIINTIRIFALHRSLRLKPQPLEE
jgi:hypothetical protein